MCCGSLGLTHEPIPILDDGIKEGLGGEGLQRLELGPAASALQCWQYNAVFLLEV